MIIEQNQNNTNPEMLLKKRPRDESHNQTQTQTETKEPNTTLPTQISTFPIPLTRAGGVYIPPFRMSKMLEELRTKNNHTTPEYQRMMWEMLRKSINGIINKVNISNIQNIIYEAFNENLIRGKGILSRAIIKAQMASPNFTHVYAALVAIINTKLPDIGRLIITRYILQFQKAYKRNNKIVCMATTKMLAHLVNQEVNSETLAFEILFLFLENPTEDSVEMACDFIQECGMILAEKNASLTHAIFERFRGILHEGEIDKRIQYTIEGLFAVRKTDFKEHPSVLSELDLVSDEDKIIHDIALDDELDGEDLLDIFKFEEDYEESEKEWISIKAEILGDDAQENEELDLNDANGLNGLNGLNTDDLNEANQNILDENNPLNTLNTLNTNNTVVTDLNEVDLLKLRRTIYLTIISSIDFQECCHKLLKLSMREGQEIELVNMIIQCCIQERTYLRFYGLLGERFCLIKDAYKLHFMDQFESQYNKIHRLETNKLRNLAKLFAHLLYTDAIDWAVFKTFNLSEEETTSSSRIFIKIIFQELAEHIGLEKFDDRLQDPSQRDNFAGLFCRDNPKNTRFCINFFTSIGLGSLTESLREFLANAEKMVEQRVKLNEDSGSDSDSDSDESDSQSDSDSQGSSDSDSQSDSRNYSRSRSDSNSSSN